MNHTVRIASVTGIDLALKVAGPGARSYAFVIDWHFRVLLAVAWVLVAMGGAAAVQPAVSSPGGSQVMMFSIMLPALAIYALYHPVLEVLMQGRTPGKRIAGVRIVTEDGSVPGVMALLIRNVLRILDSLPALYVVGLIATMVTRNAVRIGDMAAGTLLVYEQTGRQATAASLARDREAIARHGLDRAELAREMVERWSELNPESRDRLSRRLLAELGDPPDDRDGDLQLMQRLRAHVPS